MYVAKEFVLKASRSEFDNFDLSFQQWRDPSPPHRWLHVLMSIGTTAAMMRADNTHGSQSEDLTTQVWQAGKADAKATTAIRCHRQKTYHAACWRLK